MPVMLKTKLSAYVKSEPIEAENALTPNELENIFKEVELEGEKTSLDTFLDQLYNDVNKEQEKEN